MITFTYQCQFLWYAQLSLMCLTQLAVNHQYPYTVLWCRLDHQWRRWINDNTDTNVFIVLTMDMLNVLMLIISGGTLWLLDEINRFLVTGCPDSLADGGIVTLQFRKDLSVLQVTTSAAPGHTLATPEGNSISLDSASSLINSQNWKINHGMTTRNNSQIYYSLPASDTKSSKWSHSENAVPGIDI